MPNHGPHIADVCGRRRGCPLLCVLGCVITQVFDSPTPTKTDRRRLSIGCPVLASSTFHGG